MDSASAIREKLRTYADYAAADPYALGGLDPEIASVLRWMAEPAETTNDGPMTVQRARREFGDRAALWCSDVPDDQVRRAIQVQGGGGLIPATLFPTREARQASPWIVYVHGGGIVVGDTEIYRGVIAQLCRGTDAAALGIDYRLAPENPFPDAWDDVLAAVKDVAARAPEFGLDPHRMVLAGDSGGAGLALATAVALRGTSDVTVRGVVLINGAFGLDLTTDSMRRFAEGYLLTREAIGWFKDLVVPTPELAADPRFNLLRADLSGLPPVYQCLSEFDPLVDEQTALSQRVRASGGLVETAIWDGTVHGFTLMAPVVRPARDALAGCCAFIRHVI